MPGDLFINWLKILFGDFYNVLELKNDKNKSKNRRSKSWLIYFIIVKTRNIIIISEIISTDDYSVKTTTIISIHLIINNKNERNQKLPVRETKNPK